MVERIKWVMSACLSVSAQLNCLTYDMREDRDNTLDEFEGQGRQVEKRDFRDFQID